MINTNDINPYLPSVVSKLFHDFDDVFSEDIPKWLPLLRGIEHQIGFASESQLLNKTTYIRNFDETRELQRQVEELIKKGFVRESMN